jgi:hypothetical protein
VTDSPQDPREAEIADARAQRQLIDNMLADLSRGVAATRPRQARIETRGRQDGYGQNLEIVYRPRGAVA